MATTFLSRFQREKSERDFNNKEKHKSSGFSLSLSRSSAALASVFNKSDVNVNKTTTTTNEEQQQQPRQPRRYVRSATAVSVTQLLSEGCNNLLQRFRRNPSERPEKRQPQQLQQQQQNQQQQQPQEKHTDNCETKRERSLSKTPTNNNNNNQSQNNLNKSENKANRSSPMSDRYRRYYGGTGAAGLYTGPSSTRYPKTTTAYNALDRVRTNLSPLHTSSTAHYNVVNRARDHDKERTPTAVSRFENKYSDILDRGRRRYDDDRDKTLEPDENHNPLHKSTTSNVLLHGTASTRPKLSSNSFGASDRKERLGRNKTSRYLGDSNDSGYLTTASSNGGRPETNLLDDNYPLDYSSRYRAGRTYGDASTSTNNSARFRPNNYYDAPELTSRRGRAYGPTRTMGNLDSAIDGAAGHARPEPPRENYVNHSHRFTGRREQGEGTTRSRFDPNKLGSEDLEILLDDRSSADNAAILMALREDSQYLEAKKFEERMRRRKELKEKIEKYEAEQKKELERKKREEEEEQKLKELEKTENDLNKKNENHVETKKDALEKDRKKETKKRSKTKKVTINIANENESESSSSSSNETSSDSNSDTSDENNETNNSLSTSKTTTTTTTNSTTTSNTTVTTTTTTTNNTTTTTSTLKSQTNTLLSDRNNNDLSKYKPSSTTSGGLMHSASSSTLGYGGLGERLGVSRSQRYQPHQQAGTYRTAAGELDAHYQRPSGISSAYRSHLFDPYNSAYGSGGASSRQRTTATHSAYQRQQQMQAYQHQAQSSVLSRSATSAALFNRSRIQRSNYASFVRVELLFIDTIMLASYLKICAQNAVMKRRVIDVI